MTLILKGQIALRLAYRMFSGAYKNRMIENCIKHTVVFQAGHISQRGGQASTFSIKIGRHLKKVLLVGLGMLKTFALIK